MRVFILANYEEETGGWAEWDWEMQLDEFLEAVLRVADMKTLPASASARQRQSQVLSVP